MLDVRVGGAGDEVHLGGRWSVLSWIEGMWWHMFFGLCRTAPSPLLPHPCEGPGIKASGLVVYA